MRENLDYAHHFEFKFMLDYLMFILIIIFLSVVFFVFQFQKSHKVNIVSHGNKLSPDTLIVP